MEIILLGLLAFVGFKFFQHNTLAGREAVRAFVFLEMLNKGMSSSAANNATDALLQDLSSDEALNAVNMAKEAYRHLHGGKQLPMIGYAYRQGMHTTMPVWYQKRAVAMPVTFSIEAAYVIGRHQAASMRETMAVDEGYKRFYNAYAGEVRRLSDASPDDPSIADLWDREPLYEAYWNGVDPLYIAAKTCDDNKLTKETFTTFETYQGAFLSELARYASDAALLEAWKHSLDVSPIRTAFAEMMHPRRAAYGYYRHMLRQEAAS